MVRRDISTRDLADQLGLALSDTRALLLGDLEIDTGLAKKLAMTIGGSESFWRNRQMDFVHSLERCLERCAPKDLEGLVKKLPVKEMRKRGWLNPNVNKAAQALAFFDVRSPDAWLSRYENRERAVAFRQSTAWDSDQAATFVWLRQAERLASLIECDVWDREGFSTELQRLRAFTKRKQPQKFFPELVERCAKFGVAVVFVPTPPGCHASGATFFMDGAKAVIVLSFRHLTDDQFWFSFFHEAAHLVLHDERALFLEDASGVTLEAEKEANDFAANLLIPKARRPELESLPARTKSIVRFSVRLGVSPGIVVGQMQHLGVIKHSQMNRLKRRFSRDELLEAI